MALGGGGFKSALVTAVVTGGLERYYEEEEYLKLGMISAGTHVLGQAVANRIGTPTSTPIIASALYTAIAPRVVDVNNESMGMRFLLALGGNVGANVATKVLDRVGITEGMPAGKSIHDYMAGGGGP